jgi:hypothetical protein
MKLLAMKLYEFKKIIVLNCWDTLTANFCDCATFNIIFCLTGG